MTERLMIYVVTRSAQYYPAGGTRDWLSTHTNREEADQAFMEADSWCTHGDRAYLIELDTEGDPRTRFRVIDESQGVDWCETTAAIA